MKILLNLCLIVYNGKRGNLQKKLSHREYLEFFFFFFFFFGGGGGILIFHIHVY